MLGGALTVIALVIALLAAWGSDVVEVTVTTLVIGPSAAGLTVTVILLVAPLGNGPSAQATLPPKLTHPGEAETNVTPLGNESVTVTPEARAGPRFAILSV